MSVSGDTPPSTSAWLELPDHRTLTLERDCYIGRVAGNEVVIPDGRVSRRHAVVRAEGGRFVLVDLGSTNGTLLNQVRIHKPTLLADGDEITIGGQRHVFCQPVAPAANSDEANIGTAVVVAKTPCWMLLASAPDSAATTMAWLAQVTEIAHGASARVKTVRPGAVMLHWRVDLANPAVVRVAILRIVAAIPRPSGARLTLHIGSVRVGAGATPAEENLLGAEVALVHRLEAAAVEFSGGCLLTAAAVASLSLTAEVRAVGARAFPGGIELQLFLLSGK